jgi:GTP cyclohydrolase I
VIDGDKVRQGMRLILEGLGEDPDAQRLRESPNRVAEAYAEIFAGLWENPADVLDVQFEEGHDEMVIVKDIPFFSMCEHHFLPFNGTAHIGYLPRGNVLGLSKLARVVEILAKRPQLQERLTSQIADTVMQRLDPMGVGVMIEAEHLCMTMRGVKKPGSSVVTSAMRGLFLDNPGTRTEFLTLIGQDRR